MALVSIGTMLQKTGNNIKQNSVHYILGSMKQYKHIAIIVLRKIVCVDVIFEVWVKRKQHSILYVCAATLFKNDENIHTFDLKGFTKRQ